MKVNRLIFALLLVALAALAGAASDPSSQALALYKAIQRQNWRSLYYLAAFPPKIKAQLEGPDKFATDVKKGIGSGENAKVVEKLFNGMRNIKVGKATVSGNHATAPTSVDITLDGNKMHFTGLARMIMDDGKWKWDLTSGDDLEKTTSQSIQELIGKPQSK